MIKSNKHFSPEFNIPREQLHYFESWLNTAINQLSGYKFTKNPTHEHDNSEWRYDLYFLDYVLGDIWTCHESLSVRLDFREIACPGPELVFDEDGNVVNQLNWPNLTGYLYYKCWQEFVLGNPTVEPEPNQPEPKMLPAPGHLLPAHKNGRGRPPRDYRKECEKYLALKAQSFTNAYIAEKMCIGESKVKMLAKLCQQRGG